MAILEIRTYNDKILRKKAEKIIKLNEIMIKLINDMFETLNKAQGIGLAASQVGYLIRLVVINMLTEDEKIQKVLINPEIIESKGKEILEEGCLSIPNIKGEVSRFSEIIVEAQDENFNRTRFKANKLLARVIQHEIDHLNGIFFIDRINFFKRRKIIKQIKKNLKRRSF